MSNSVLLEQLLHLQYLYATTSIESYTYKQAFKEHHITPIVNEILSRMMKRDTVKLPIK